MKPPDRPTPGQPRKPYSTPIVRAYGSVRAITRNGGVSSAVMDSLNSKSKTS